jgi:hypothetical protein
VKSGGSHRGNQMAPVEGNFAIESKQLGILGLFHYSYLNPTLRLDDYWLKVFSDPDEKLRLFALKLFDSFDEFSSNVMCSKIDVQTDKWDNSFINRAYKESMLFRRCMIKKLYSSILTQSSLSKKPDYTNAVQRFPNIAS